MSLESYYKDLYEQEKLKNERLTEELVRVEADNSEMKEKLDTLKNSKLFKLIKPFRNVYARGVAVKERIRRLGSFSEFVRKLKSKRIEMQAYKLHGTMSFPDEERRKTILLEPGNKLIQIKSPTKCDVTLNLVLKYSTINR